MGQQFYRLLGLLALSTSCLLTGCGQMGPLYMPTPAPNVVTSTPTPQP